MVGRLRNYYLTTRLVRMTRTGRLMGMPWSSRTVRFSEVPIQTKQLSNLPGSSGLYAPRWSPDGRFICGLTIDQKKLMLFEVARGQWSELASGQAIEYPNWTRDGRFVYFETSGDGGRELFRVN